MARLLRLPGITAGATEAILSEWQVGDGATVAAGDTIVTIETEKALVDVEAESDAVLLRQLVGNGATVEVGAPIALLGSAAERQADLDALLAQLGVTGNGAGGAEPPPPPQPASHQPPSPEPLSPELLSPEPLSPEPLSPADRNGHGRIFSSPLARRLLKNAGVDLADVTGTGPGGRVTRSDAEKAIAAAAAPAPAPLTPEAAPAPAPPAPEAEPGPVPPVAAKGPYAGATAVAHTRQRRAVAARLTESKTTVPHFYLKRTVRLDPLLKLRAELNRITTEKISVNDLIVKAVGRAHLLTPEANVVWTDEAMLSLAGADVAVAIASRRGLVTPVLRGVENLTPSAISAQIKDFVRRADEGRLQQRELEGGSITVTNLGMYGVDEFAAIINPPHSAIVAVGAGRPAPVVGDGQVWVENVLPLTLSVDHRALDGALAARWLQGLVEIIEQPLRLLA